MRQHSKTLSQNLKIFNEKLLFRKYKAKDKLVRKTYLGTHLTNSYPQLPIVFKEILQIKKPGAVAYVWNPELGAVRGQGIRSSKASYGYGNQPAMTLCLKNK